MISIQKKEKKRKKALAMHQHGQHHMEIGTGGLKKRVVGWLQCFTVPHIVHQTMTRLCINFNEFIYYYYLIVAIYIYLYLIHPFIYIYKLFVEVLRCDGVVTQIVISKLPDMSACGCLSVVLLYCLIKTIDTHPIVYVEYQIFV